MCCSALFVGHSLHHFAERVYGRYLLSEKLEFALQILTKYHTCSNHIDHLNKKIRRLLSFRYSNGLLTHLVVRC